jgi:hypothetical protein
MDLEIGLEEWEKGWEKLGGKGALAYGMWF